MKKYRIEYSMWDGEDFLEPNVKTGEPLTNVKIKIGEFMREHPNARDGDVAGDIMPIVCKVDVHEDGTEEWFAVYEEEEEEEP